MKAFLSINDFRADGARRLPYIALLSSRPMIWSPNFAAIDVWKSRSENSDIIGSTDLVALVESGAVEIGGRERWRDPVDRQRLQDSNLDDEIFAFDPVGISLLNKTETAWGSLGDDEWADSIFDNRQSDNADKKESYDSGFISRAIELADHISGEGGAESGSDGLFGRAKRRYSAGKSSSIYSALIWQILRDAKLQEILVRETGCDTPVETPFFGSQALSYVVPPSVNRSKYVAVDNKIVIESIEELSSIFSTPGPDIVNSIIKNRDRIDSSRIYWQASIQHLMKLMYHETKKNIEKNKFDYRFFGDSKIEFSLSLMQHALTAGEIMSLVFGHIPNIIGVGLSWGSSFYRVMKISGSIRVAPSSDSNYEFLAAMLIGKSKIMKIEVLS